MFQKKYKVLISIFVGISAALLSCWCSLDYSTIYLIIAGIISAIFISIKVYRNFEESVNFIKSNILLSIVTILFTFFLLYNIAINKRISNIYLCNNLIKLKFIPIVSISTFYIIISTIKFLITFIKDLTKKFNSWDKKAYFYTTIIFSLLVLFLYSTQTKWFLQYDNVYSIDSGWTLQKIYSSFAYYDIRHPLMSIFTYPLYIAVKAICIIFIPSNFHLKTTAIALQLINVQFIILIALMLKKLTDDSKEMYLLYIFSYSSIMYLLSFEKYQYCVFLLVAYVYESENNNIYSNELFCFAISLIPTSCFIILQKLFTRQNIKEKIYSIFNTMITAICIFSLFGRFSLFFNASSQISVMRSRFGGGSWSLQQKIISLLKMWQGSFLPLSTTPTKTYTWSNTYLTKIDFMTSLVIFLILLGIYFSKKNIFSKTSIIWFLFSILLIIKFQWSVQESQLFSFYFSWAIIPFVKYGIDKLINWLKFKPKVTYFIIFSYILLLDYLDIISIVSFFKK